MNFRCRWHCVGPVKETWKLVNENKAKHCTKWCSWCFNERAHYQVTSTIESALIMPV